MHVMYVCNVYMYAIGVRMLVWVCGYVCNVNSVRKLCVCMGMCVNSWGFEQRWNLRGFEPRRRWNHPRRREYSAR